LKSVANSTTGKVTKILSKTPLSYMFRQTKVKEVHAAFTMMKKISTHLSV